MKIHKIYLIYDFLEIEISYSKSEEEVWDAFTSSPVQPAELQTAVLSWARSAKNFSLAARLYHWIDYHDLRNNARSRTLGTINKTF